MNELLPLTSCRCLHCGREWDFVMASINAFETACCGTVSVSLKPWQFTFSDSGGSWLRRVSLVDAPECA